MGKKLLNSIKAIGFDVDGTLYHSSVEMSAWIGRELVAKAAKILKREVSEFADEYLTRREELRSNTMALKSFGLDGERIFQALWDEIPLEKYVKKDGKLQALLTDLNRRYRLFIISNGTAKQVRKKLNYLGLETAIFQPFIACYDQGWVKPEPAPFLAALEALQLPAEQVVYVGDREDVDVEGAKAVGMKTILVGGDSDKADVSCETVYDIVNVL